MIFEDIVIGNEYKLDKQVYTSITDTVISAGAIVRVNRKDRVSWYSKKPSVLIEYFDKNTKLFVWVDSNSITPV